MIKVTELEDVLAARAGIMGTRAARALYREVGAETVEDLVKLSQEWPTPKVLLSYRQIGPKSLDVIEQLLADVADSSTQTGEKTMRKTEVLRRLRDLRQEIEAGQGALSEEQACLLTDVCQSLGLVDAETYYVVGETFQTFITAPVPYKLVRPGAFVVAFAKELGPVDAELLATVGPKTA